MHRELLSISCVLSTFLGDEDAAMRTKAPAVWILHFRREEKKNKQVNYIICLMVRNATRKVEQKGGTEY